jgi:hypothetical protein
MLPRIARIAAALQPASSWLAAALRTTPSFRAAAVLQRAGSGASRHSQPSCFGRPERRPTTTDCSWHALNALRAFDRARS